MFIWHSSSFFCSTILSLYKFSKTTKCQNPLEKIEFYKPDIVIFPLKKPPGTNPDDLSTKFKHLSTNQKVPVTYLSIQIGRMRDAVVGVGDFPVGVVVKLGYFLFRVVIECFCISPDGNPVFRGIRINRFIIIDQLIFSHF